MEAKLIKPTQQHVDYIAKNMRAADVAEVWASDRHTPDTAMVTSFDQSEYSATATVDGVPCLMLGVGSRGPLTQIGIPWMLGTDGVVKHRHSLTKLVGPVMDEMSRMYPILLNYVHTKNTVSVKWLARIGFTVEPAQPHGLTGELFHRFERMT